MKRAMFTVPALVLVGLMGVGCASSYQDGVTSTYRSQKEMVYADTKATTDAAEAIFKEADLKEVGSKSTAIDGKAWGTTADGTKVWATIDQADKGSTVWVNVGKLGDPKQGAMFVTNIKKRAEGK